MPVYIYLNPIHNNLLNINLFINFLFLELNEQFRRKFKMSKEYR